MTRTRMLRAALACATLLLPTTAAHAATTVSGTVVGAPVVTAGTATVPVLVGERSRARLRVADPVVRVRVPRERGVRARTGVLRPGGLRIGDRVRAALGRVRDGAASARVLRVGARGGVASFDRIEAARTRAREQAARAAQELADLDATGSSAAAPTDPAPGVLRDALLGLRRDLELLIADLRLLTAQVEAVAARIERERPADPARRRAVARRQAPLLAGLTSTREELTTARAGLEEAVTRLDTALLDVGGASDPSLPIGTVGTVSDVVQTVLFLLSKVQLPAAR